MGVLTSTLKFYLGENYRMPMIANAATLLRIQNALEHQKKKFGLRPIATDMQAVCILGEEYGEFCRGINQRDQVQAEKEAIQIIAVTLAWLEGDLHYGDDK
jgi:hypothetical protein